MTRAYWLPPGETSEARLPRGVQVGAGGKPLVQFEHDHAVRERPGGPGQVGVAAHRRHQRRGRPVLQPGRQQCGRASANAWSRPA